MSDGVRRAPRIRPTVVILAAGQGTRMRSSLPKVLHEAAGVPLLEHVLRAVAPLDPERVVVVVGHEAERVKARFAGAGVRFAEQREQLGTGHALLQAKAEADGGEGPLLVLNGDGPLLLADTLARLVAAQVEGGGLGMTLLTSIAEDPSGLGRIVRAPDGTVTAIVEEKDADEAIRAIREVNPGLYVFDRDAFALAATLGNHNASGEYYITDLVRLYLEAGRPVRAVVAPTEEEVLAVNDRVQLAQVDAILRDRIRQRWMKAGVTMVAPGQVFLDDSVVLEPDVVLHPGVCLCGATVVRRGAVVGAYAVLTDCEVTAGAAVPAHAVIRGRRI